MFKYSYNYKAHSVLLLDNVHNISNKVHAATHMGGVNQLEMNFNTYSLLEEVTIKELNRRYRIVIDKDVKKNEILLTYADSIEGIITIINI